jgi:ribonuclease P protein component
MRLLFLQKNSIKAHHTYNRDEKLKSRKVIEHLFKKGKSMNAFPIKLLYDVTEDHSTFLKAGVTVSSRTFKKAVQRNRVKRILREVYRLQKGALEAELALKEQYLAVFFIYIGKELPVFSEVYNKMGILLEKLKDTLSKK